MDDKNSIVIDNATAVENTIFYHYKVTGAWAEAFDLDQPFKVKYGTDVTAVPVGIAIIPLLANILPMAWVYDAVVEAPICDADFLACLPEVKHGYEEMYPTMRFGGELRVNAVEENRRPTEGALCFFSGGMDAFNTLIQHVQERPALLTIRGADVKLDDAEGWSRVRAHGEEVAEDFDVEFHEVASTFRTFLREGILDKRVSESGDGWWHGFQHGLGLIGHAAPIAHLLGKETVYIASSFTAEDAGTTCASDPSIDNHVRFCGARVVHDGYDFSRQDKARNIVRFSQETGTPIKLRVCWESEGGSNCCTCEKCGRTILELISEGADPRDYGFQYSNGKFDYLMRKLHYYLIIHYPQFYRDIARAAKENGVTLPRSAHWVLSPNVERICSNTRKRVLNRMYGWACRLVRRTN